MRTVAVRTAIVLVAVGVASCRRPATARGTLEITLGQTTSAATFDPHGRDLSQTSITLSHFYEPLVAFGSEMELKASLAERFDAGTR